MIKLDDSVEGFVNYATVRFTSVYDQLQRDECYPMLDLNWQDFRSIVVNHLLGVTDQIESSMANLENNDDLMSSYTWMYEKYFALGQGGKADAYAYQTIEWLGHRVMLNLSELLKLLKGYDEYYKIQNSLMNEKYEDTEELDRQLRVVRVKYPWIEAQALVKFNKDYAVRKLDIEAETYSYHLYLGKTNPMPQEQQKEFLKKATIEMLWQKYHSLMKLTDKKEMDKANYIKGFQELISDQQWQELFAPLAG